MSKTVTNNTLKIGLIIQYAKNVQSARIGSETTEENMMIDHTGTVSEYTYLPTYPCPL